MNAKRELHDLVLHYIFPWTNPISLSNSVAQKWKQTEQRIARDIRAIDPPIFNDASLTRFCDELEHESSVSFFEPCLMFVPMHSYYEYLDKNPTKEISRTKLIVSCIISWDIYSKRGFALRRDDISKSIEDLISPSTAAYLTPHVLTRALSDIFSETKDEIYLRSSLGCHKILFDSLHERALNFGST